MNRKKLIQTTRKHLTLFSNCCQARGWRDLLAMAVIDFISISNQGKWTCEDEREVTRLMKEIWLHLS